MPCASATRRSTNRSTFRGVARSNVNWSGACALAVPCTDLARWSAEEIEAVAHTLNARPRKTLGWKTPAEAFNEELLLLHQAGVACTD